LEGHVARVGKVRSVSVGSLKGRDDLEDLDIDRTILKLISK